MTNRIGSIKIGSLEYNTLMITPDNLAQFVKDVNSAPDTQKVLDHYGIREVRT